MSIKVTCFPVGNGDMTLIRVDDPKKTSILVDCCISANGGSACDVETELRHRLQTDDKDRPYVDAFCLTHADEDHIRGLRNHFHLGELSDYDDNPEEGQKLKIIIREMWSSPLVFRRKSTNNKLCDDAIEWRAEAKRRVTLFRKTKKQASSGSGDRILLIGKDVDDDGKDKNADIGAIVADIGDQINEIDGRSVKGYSADIIAPLPKGTVDGDEKSLASNRSSIILGHNLTPKEGQHTTRLLTTGDAQVEVWKRLWAHHKENTEALEYDILVVPHHCSWHSLSEGSWGKGSREVNQDARDALSQARDGASLVASSQPIENDKADPPCVGAKKEYRKIADDVDGEFFCTGEYPTKGKDPKPLTFTITGDGQEPLSEDGGGSRSKGLAGSSATSSAFDKKGGTGGYAER